MAEKQKVLLKRSSVPGKMPSEITGSTVDLGELFLNIASGDADNFLTTLRAEGSSAVTSDYIKWSDDVANEKKFATKEEVMDNELVVSTIITKINESVGLDENSDSVLPNGESLSEAIIALQNNSVGAPMTTITYSELKTLRDESKLIPGMKYRITDYNTTTSQENTSSAGHQFDVIVTALDNKTLSEEASACLHDGDTYFSSANAKLEAWKLWYCLDNDTDRFAWADTENGKGVIYRMIDEGRNDLPYDFKNIMFRRYKLNAPESVDSDPVLAKMSEIIQAQFSAGTLSYIWGGFLPDEDRYWENSWGELYSTTTGEYMDFYTFSDVISGVVSDISLNIFRCYDNVMGITYDLNGNVFFSDGGDSLFCLNSFGIECLFNSFLGECSNNSFGNYCSYNSFGGNCYYNSFGEECGNNSFGVQCSYNSFVNGCLDNIFGEFCYNNSFGDGCYAISFGRNCFYNSFGERCGNNSFGEKCSCNSFVNDCSDNIFENYCSGNTFGRNCSGNTFGYKCAENSFGNDCSGNTFGMDCSGNTFGDRCYAISFGDKCSNNSFGNSCHDNSFGDKCINNSFGRGCINNSFGRGYINNSFGDGCEYNSFGRDCTNNSFGVECFNNSFDDNCQYINFGDDDYCSNNSFGNSCKFINLVSSGISSSGNRVQNYKFTQGLQGTYSTPITITAECNRGYETKVAKNSSGEIKIYCEADLIA